MKKSISVSILTLLCAILFPLTVCAMETIQTQPSSDGNFEASLFGVKVRGNVLTIKLKMKNVAAKSVKSHFYYNEVYFTDIKEKKKYFALKDSEGNYIAGPRDRDSNGGAVERYIGTDEQVIVWVKFPAPPETSDTIDIIVPGILPFEEIKLNR